MTEGVGNAPIAQKIAGTEEKEEKGYLSQAYEAAGGAVKVVYDAAGNVVSPRIFLVREFFLCTGLGIS